MHGFIKQTFIVLVLLLLDFCGTLVTKYISIHNQSCMIGPVLFDWNSDKLIYYLFIISLDRSDASCNTAEYPFGRICVPNKMKNVNLKLFNMIRAMNESKPFVKQTSWERRCVLDGRKCKSKQKLNKD